MSSSYHHLSPTQIDGLSFIITLTLRGDGGENEEQQFHIHWQEKIHSSTNDAEPSQVNIFTYTNEDVIANNQTEQGFTLRSDLESMSATTRSLMDRSLDDCQAMVIAAKPRHDDEATLCVIKLYPDSGQLSATPQFSETEPEDYEGSVFISDNSIKKILETGQRLTTYSSGVYEYTIQCPIIDEDNRNMDHMIAERVFDREDARREKICDDFDSCDALYDGSNDVFTHAAHIELVSIEGDAFVQSNLLLSSPHGSNISVQYKVKEEERLLLEGSSTSVSTCSSACQSLEFVSNFVITFIGVAFVLMLWYVNYGHEYSLALLFAIVPLGLIINAAIGGSEASLYHINHQFSLLFNNNRDTTKTNQLVLELKVFFQNNFGFESLAGCGTVNIPTKTGAYDLHVPTWKPIACPGVGETRGRMYDYFLGSSCEVGPQDPMHISELELSKDTDIRLLSKAGLHTKSTGSIRLKVNIMPNLFKDKIKADVVNNHHHRVKMRETVDEVLNRVRLNKIERVRRSRTSLP